MIFQTRHLQSCSFSLSLSLLFFSFFFFYKTAFSISNTHAMPFKRMPGYRVCECVYTPCPYFATLPFFLSSRCKIKQSLCSMERDPAVFTGKIVGKIRGGRVTNKKFATLLTQLSSQEYLRILRLFIDKCYEISS